jgi:hypothetical protein
MGAARLSERPESTDGRGALTGLLLWCGVIAGPLFVAAFLIEVATSPGYDPMRLPVSLLSLGEGGWRQVANFLVDGLLLLGFAAGVYGVLHDLGTPSTAGPLLLAIFAVGVIGAGVFSTDPGGGYPPGARYEPSLTGRSTTWSRLSCSPSCPWRVSFSPVASLPGATAAGRSIPRLPERCSPRSSSSCSSASTEAPASPPWLALSSAHGSSRDGAGCYCWLRTCCARERHSSGGPDPRFQGSGRHAWPSRKPIPASSRPTAAKPTLTSMTSCLAIRFVGRALKTASSSPALSAG